MNTKNKIGIHFLGLTPKETALFERVISFNVTHGLKATIEDDITKAELIIVTTESYDLLDHNSSNNTHLVIANDDSDTKGDLQIIRPLMITKVMASLTTAVNLSKEKQNAIVTETTNSTQEPLDENLGLIEVKIEGADSDIVDLANASIIETNSSDPVNKSVSVTETMFTTSEKVEQSKHHALIIDDSAAIRKQLELELRDAGISSDFAECGEDALEKIKTNQFDLVFLDIIMPGIDGYETCKSMRSNAAFKKTPIIMLSGKTSPLDEVQGVIAGATTYLTKPVKSDKLQETLNRVTKWIENYAPPKHTESV